MNISHIGNILEVTGPSEQGTLHGKALQDLFFIRSLLLRAEDVAGFLAKQKQKLRVRKKEETEDYVPNERT